MKNIRRILPRLLFVLTAVFASSALCQQADIPVLRFGLDGGTRDVRQITGLSNIRFPPEERPAPEDFVKDFLRGARFIVLTKLGESLCRENIGRLVSSDSFMKKFRAESREDAMYSAAAYYFNHRTPLITGRGNSGCAIVDRGLAPGSGSPLTAGFDLSFRTVYSAELHYIYYLRNYPDGSYILPAMLGIARCRILQKDWDEAYSAYKYAVMAELSRYGVDSDVTASKIAGQLTAISEKHGADFDIRMRIEQEPECTGVLRSKVTYRNRKAFVRIRISCG